jgi:signal peptidase II
VRSLSSAVWPSLVLGLFAFGLDRGHKYFQIEIAGWRGGEYIPVTGFFDYVLVWNTGVSYGLLSGVPFWVLGVVIAAALLALAIWWWRAEDPLLRTGLACCVGGAISNALDRILYGAVADFFHFHWQDYSFYIFNIADAAITLGVLLMVLDLLGIGGGRRREVVE